MVLSENPSCNSVRIQRAYRINNIEQGRLFHRIHLLDKERIRKVRLVNQDIRIINLTMEFIHSSSGQSPEGRSSEDLKKDEMLLQEEEMGACFMYGERMISRRFGKNKRASSAVPSLASSRRSSIDEGDKLLSPTSASSARSRLPRPHSSPLRRGFFITRPDTPGSSKAGDESLSPSCSPRSLRPKTASDIQRKASTLQTEPVSGNPKLPATRLGFSQPMYVRPKTACTIKAKDSKTDKQELLSQHSETAEEVSVSSRKRPTLHARNSKITHAVSQARVKATEARKQKKMTIHNLWLGPLVPQTPKQKAAMEARKEEVKGHLSLINERVNSFNEKYPLVKY